MLTKTFVCVCVCVRVYNAILYMEYEIDVCLHNLHIYGYTNVKFIGTST